MKKIVLFAAVAIALGASSAGAAPTLCLPGPNGSGLALTDVTLDGVNATNCYGLVDANTNNISDAALKFGEAEAWGTEIKDDTPGNPVSSGTGTFFGVDWTLSANAGPNNNLKQGSWSLSFVDTNPSKLDFYADILVLLKGGNGYAAYFFNDFLFDKTSNAGTWDINFLNRGGQTPDISHMSVYFRDGSGCDDCSPDQQSVPEPASLVLLGTALFGVGVARRRRQQASSRQ